MGRLLPVFPLFNFYFDCYDDLPSSVEDFRIRKRWGPAWYCYLFCALSGIIRAWAHWVTPTPDHGVGCCTFRLPHAIMALLDVDGDGKLTWEDQKLLFGSLKTVLAQQASQRVGSFRKSLSFQGLWSGDWQGRARRKKLEATIAKQREEVCGSGRGAGGQP